MHLIGRPHTRPGLRPAALLAAGAVWALAAPRTAPGQEAGAGGLKLRVTEVAQSVDLARGRERFLTLTVEITGADAARLRRVQPLREDFTVVAAARRLPCRWLRGGTLPEDPQRLRFTLGFPMPAPGVRKVGLEANLPRLERSDALELRLGDLEPGARAQERSGPSWSVTVRRFEETDYTPPALPPSGRFTSKAGPVDARVYRAPGSDPEPARAWVVDLFSRNVELYDRTVDVSGRLLLEGGGSVPLLSALMKRDPSAALKRKAYPPFMEGSFYFSVPRGRRPTGVLLTLARRPAGAAGKPLRIENLPVP